MRAARFHQLRDRAIAAVDRVFAETVRVSPMKDGASDPLRPQHEFDAILRVKPGEAGSVKGGGGKSWSGRVAAGLSMLAIDQRSYAGPPIRMGDRIRALSVPGEPVFEVARVDDRDGNRLVIELNEAGS